MNNNNNKDNLNEDNLNEDNLNEGNDISQKLQDLNMLNITYTALILTGISIIIVTVYIRWQIIQALDGINNTNFSQQIGDLTDFPKRANIISLISITMFVIVNNYAYQSTSSITGEDRDEAAICDAWKGFIATVLFLIGTYINYTVLNRPK